MVDGNLINIFKIDKPNVCFVGDIHGDFKSLQHLMKHTGFKDTAYIIAGDCGFGFTSKENYSQVFNKLSRTASNFNCEFLFVRGNHEDKAYFDKQLINRKYFKTLPDYSVVQTPTHNILCIGGAFSVDRTYRKGVMKENALRYSIYHGCTVTEAERFVPKIFWEDEYCYYDEERLEQIKLSGIKVDIVCTHTCPSFVKPYGKNEIKTWLAADGELENDLNKERKVMDDIYNKLKGDGHQINLWVYGHFHYHSQEYVDETKFVMLDMYRNGSHDIYDLQG